MVIRSLFNRFIRSRLHSSNFQEEIDTYTIASLLHIKGDFKNNKKPKDIKHLKLSYRKQKSFISKTFDHELLRLFSFVHKKGGIDPYPAPIIQKLNDEELLSYEDIAAKRSDVITESEARKQELEISERPLEHPDGFILQIKYSNIDHPSAGFGVFLQKGNILPGTVLGLYPGFIYTKEDFSKLNKDSEYMLTGYDGIVTDADKWAESAIKLRRQLRTFTNISLDTPKQLLQYKNPFAISNYINHPPKGFKPNVLAYTYSFDLSKFPNELKPYIPYKFKYKPSWYYVDSLSGRSIVIVATKYIKEGSELYLDYRYNPNFSYPEWYYPVDEEAARLRWGPTRIIY